MFDQSNDELWVLEWSQRSNNIHIQPLARTAGVNMCRFFLDQPPPNDYVTLAAGTYEEVSRSADTLRKALIQREQLRELREAVHA